MVKHHHDNIEKMLSFQPTDVLEFWVFSGDLLNIGMLISMFALIQLELDQPPTAAAYKFAILILKAGLVLLPSKLPDMHINTKSTILQQNKVKIFICHLLHAIGYMASKPQYKVRPIRLFVQLFCLSVKAHIFLNIICLSENL